MDIKKNLKTLDIKISKMANDFGISRPTLDSYIEAFEAGKEIPNEIFQEIFVFLFTKEIDSSVEFAQKYDYVKRVMLKDAKEQTYTQKNQDNKENRIQSIIKQVSDENVSLESINFVNLFLSNQNNELVKEIINYFNYANGFVKINEEKLDDNQKIIYSNLARVFTLYKSEELPFEKKFFDEFVLKNEKQTEIKIGKVQSEDIIKYIKDNISDSSNIDFELLEKMIKAKEA